MCSSVVWNEIELEEERRPCCAMLCYAMLCCASLNPILLHSIVNIFH